jgi:hypothetical protein
MSHKYRASSSFPEYSVYTVKNNTTAIEKWINMTRNPRKSCSRISNFMIAKEDSDAKGVLVTINSNSRMNNKGEDGEGTMMMMMKIIIIII